MLCKILVVEEQKTVNQSSGLLHSILSSPTILSSNISQKKKITNNYLIIDFLDLKNNQNLFLDPSKFFLIVWEVPCSSFPSGPMTSGKTLGSFLAVGFSAGKKKFIQGKRLDLSQKMIGKPQSLLESNPQPCGWKGTIPSHLLLEVMGSDGQLQIPFPE